MFTLGGTDGKYRMQGYFSHKKQAISFEKQRHVAELRARYYQFYILIWLLIYWWINMQ